MSADVWAVIGVGVALAALILPGKPPSGATWPGWASDWRGWKVSSRVG